MYCSVISLRHVHDITGVWYHAEFGVCRGAGVVLSEMRSCVFMCSLEYVVFGTAAATFECFLCALNGCTEFFLYMPTNIWEDQTDDE